MSVVEGSASVLSRSVAEMLGSGEAGSGSLVTVATDDAPVVGWLVLEADPAGCDERWCAVIESSSGVVLASGPVSGVMVSGSPCRWSMRCRGGRRCWRRRRGRSRGCAPSGIGRAPSGIRRANS